MGRAGAFIVVLLAGSLAGCTNVPDAGDPDGSPAGETGAPDGGVDPAPDDGVAACLAMTLTVEPEAAHVGARIYVNATLTNGCLDAVEVQGSDSCSKNGMAAAHEDHGVLQDGAAGAQGCYLYMPPPRSIPPGASLEETWIWNGTFLRPGDGRYEPVQAGEHRVHAWVLRDATVTAEAWVTLGIE